MAWESWYCGIAYDHILNNTKLYTLYILLQGTVSADVGIRKGPNVNYSYQSHCEKGQAVHKEATTKVGIYRMRLFPHLIKNTVCLAIVPAFTIESVTSTLYELIAIKAFSIMWNVA